MGQRSATGMPARQPGGTWDTFIKCEIEHDTHEVHPTHWPPQRFNASDLNPSMSLPCVRCGVNCIVYRGHATGQMKGITVVLPEAAKA